MQSQFAPPYRWDSVDDTESSVSSGDPTRRILDLVITKYRGSATSFVSEEPTPRDAILSPAFNVSSLVGQSSSGDDLVSEGGSDEFVSWHSAFTDSGSVESNSGKTDSSTGDGQRDSSGGSSSSAFVLACFRLLTIKCKTSFNSVNTMWSQLYNICHTKLYRVLAHLSKSNSRTFKDFQGPYEGYITRTKLKRSGAFISISRQSSSLKSS